LSHELEVGERRSLASHYTLTTAFTITNHQPTRYFIASCCYFTPGPRLPS